MSADFDPLTYEEILINDAAACMSIRWAERENRRVTRTTCSSHTTHPDWP